MADVQGACIDTPQSVSGLWAANSKASWRIANANLYEATFWPKSMTALQ